MSVVIKTFLSWHIFPRAVILLFLFLVFFWRLFRWPILWALSFVVLILKRIVICVYLIIELPVSWLHKEWGGWFRKLDLGWAKVGEKADTVMDRWHKTWNCPSDYCLWKNLSVYAICVFLVVLSSMSGTEASLLKTGERAYLWGETLLVNLMEAFGWYDPSAQAWQRDHTLGSESAQKGGSEITLVVSGVNSSLLVRDVPSVEDFIVLDRVYNGDTVLWSGELVFAEADGGHVEPWVKIVTESGVEGWSRLYYLRPEAYDGLEFFVSH